MGADNWAVCPKCLKERKLTKIQKAQKAYGKVSLEEFNDLLNVAKAEDEEYEENKFTLREDFEIGINEDGKFIIGFPVIAKSVNYSSVSRIKKAFH